MGRRTSILFALLSLVTAGRALAQDTAAETPAADAPATATTEAPAAEAEPAADAEPADGWDAIVLSYGGDSTEDVAATARDAASLALENEGFRVLPEAEVTARISPARLHDASSIDALRAIGDELGARSVVTVAVWTSDGAPASVAVSIATGGRSFSGTADVETDLATAATAAVRAALERQRRALVLSGGASGSVTTTHTDDDDDDGTPGVVEGDPWADHAPEPEEEDGPEELFGIIGPGFLLALGGAGLGLGIYAVLDATCDLRQPMTGECVRGEEPNVGLGTLFIVGGAIATAGAIIWWITDAALTNEPRIDVVDLDLLFLEGGALGVARGSF